MAQVLHYPFATELAAAEHGDVIAWVCNLDGVRNVWVARGTELHAEPRRLSITMTTGRKSRSLLFRRTARAWCSCWAAIMTPTGPPKEICRPIPAPRPQQPVTAIWAMPASGGAPVKIDEGDAPVISARGQIAYIKDDHVWIASLDGGKPERLFFDRGKDSDLTWSPDGSRLAFVSDRGRSLLHRDLHIEDHAAVVSRAFHQQG